MTERPLKDSSFRADNLRPLDGAAPEDVRDAVRQLSLAFRRSKETLEAAQGELSAHVVTPSDDRALSAAAEALRRAEAVLFAAGEPLSAEQVALCLPHGVEVADVLMELKRVYAHRGVNLVEVGGRWRFQTAGDLSYLFVEERQEQRKLSQAALETLAIIAYGQPVTRAEIEDVRGVAVSKDTIDRLVEAGWVRLRGRRRTPGRPVTYGTTAAFLEHFGLESLSMLPGRSELEAQGLLQSVVPDGFDMPGAGGAAAEEDPLDDGDGGDDAGRAFHTDFMDGEDEAGGSD